MDILLPKKSFFFLFIMLWTLGQHCLAGNPLIKDIGMSDPHVRVFNDKIYLYSGHDSSPTDTLWVMKDWRVFSSTNLISWQLETTISPKENYMPDNSANCWACDATTRNGKYFFYFSDGKRGIGVMSAAQPCGPFADALGRSLVSSLHDPTAFIDDDANRTPYLIYGDKANSYRIARLNEDMISLAQTPVPITIRGTEWVNAPTWMDKNYLFKRNGVYYLSWGGDYANSTNVYGPYDSVGSLGKGFGLGIFAHGSFFEWKGQFYHIWCYYLKSGFKYRETVMTYCHFDNAGKVVDDMDFMNQHFATGMGQYDASWPKIEAEWYYEKSLSLKKQDCAEGGFEIAGIEDGSWLRFANMNCGAGVNLVDTRVSCTGSGARIEMRRDSPSGPLIGTVNVSNTGSPLTYANFSGVLNGVGGINDIYLRFAIPPRISLRLNSFKLNVLAQFPDSDLDGLPDPWEMQYFNTLSNTGTDDADGDGQSNGMEFIAGTNPVNLKSWFHINSISAAGGGFIVKWDSVVGRNYTVLKSGAVSGGWTSASAALAGTGGEFSFTDLSGTSDNRFYKIQVTLP